MAARNGTYPSWESIVQLRYQLRDSLLTYYLHHDLFSIGWWVALAAVVISVVVWWKLVDKRRLPEVVLFGALLCLIASFLDVIGANLLLWSYPTMLVPLAPPLLGIDIGPIPMFYMIVYQRHSSWWTYLRASIFAAAFMAFIGEPVAHWVGLYDLTNWKYIYSFPLWIGVALLAKWIMTQIYAVRPVNGN